MACGGGAGQCSRGEGAVGVASQRSRALGGAAAGAAGRGEEEERSGNC